MDLYVAMDILKHSGTISPGLGNRNKHKTSDKISEISNIMGVSGDNAKIRVTP